MRTTFLTRILVTVVCAANVCAVAGDADYPISRYVRYGFTLQNTTDQVVPLTELWVCAPLKQTSSQRCVQVNASQASDSIEDRLGNNILHFVFSNMAPYAVKLVNIEATVDLSPTPLKMKAELQPYMDEDPMAQFRDPEFNALAPEFDVTGWANKAKAILRWIQNNIKDSGFDSTDHDALYALKNRKGDCTEYTHLFVALCRKNGMAARAMGGYPVSQNQVLDPMSYHNWAEIYLDGRWQIADAQNDIFMTNAEYYVATRILGESDSALGASPRIRYVGDGIKVSMNTP